MIEVIYSDNTWVIQLVFWLSILLAIVSIITMATTDRLWLEAVSFIVAIASGLSIFISGMTWYSKDREDMTASVGASSIIAHDDKTIVFDIGNTAKVYYLINVDGKSYLMPSDNLKENR